MAEPTVTPLYSLLPGQGPDELSSYGKVFQAMAAARAARPARAADEMAGGDPGYSSVTPELYQPPGGVTPPVGGAITSSPLPEAQHTPPLAERDAAIKEQAASEAGSTTLNGASPEAILAALHGLGGGRIVGMTKGGFQPSTRGEATQTESKVFPEEWYRTLRDLDMHGRSASEGEAIGAAELSRAQGEAAAKRASMLTEQAGAEEASLAREERAREFAQQRIDRAISEFQASGPRFENYGTLFEESGPYQKAAGLGGMLLGLFGAANTGGPSAFTKQLDGLIERRAQTAEADSRRKGMAVGMLENSFSRLERSFGDARAARAAIRALYAEQAKSALENEAAQIGVGLEHPMLQRALADLDAKKLGYLKDTAATVGETARAEEKYVPPTAIVAPGGGLGLEAGESGKEIEADQNFNEELVKRKIPERLSALDMMDEASRAIGKDDTTFWANVASATPGTFGRLYALAGADPARQKYLAAYNLYLATLSGKTVSKEEAPRLASMLGSGDAKARSAALDTLNRPVQEDIDTLRAGGWDAPAKRYMLKREYNQRLGRSGFDRVGVGKPEPQTEPVPVR